MAQEPLLAHSLAEAYLYLAVTPCANCGHGPLVGAGAMPVGSDREASPVSIEATCSSCHQGLTFCFRLSVDSAHEGASELAAVNTLDESSRIIDVAQWLTLYRITSESATRETDKVKVRQLALKAGQCLEEAIKFFDERDNDLPPQEAFFCETSRQRFRDHPEQFSRQRIINLRAKLPRPLCDTGQGEMPNP